MKKVSVIAGIIGFVIILAVVGCGEKAMSPEDVAKTYIDAKFKDVASDLDDLDYKLVEEEDGAVKVRIKGKIKYEEVLSMVQQDGKWVMGSKAEKAEDVKEGHAPSEDAGTHNAVQEKAHH
ncbi:MAG: hypothetical protein KJ737_13745 [Proteobacteria bacterium]|nr:hypothetical protein [Pseudomonadota bacterium]